jgi:branched-subunit amino acid ABC-type transport system permease component
LSHFLQIVLAGISIGAIYSLAALGFTIVFKATKVTNFANGEFVMMGGLVSTTLVSNANWPTLAAVAVAAVVVTAVGVALYKFGVQQARRKTILGYAMVTIGFSLLYRGIMQVGVGRDVLFMPNFWVLPEFEVPVGFLICPNDTNLPAPDSVLERSYNVARRTDAPTGGHFTALEQPGLFIDEVRSFFRAYR